MSVVLRRRLLRKKRSKQFKLLSLLIIFALVMLTVLIVKSFENRKVVVFEEELRAEKQLDKNVEPMRLAGWILDHFIYDMSYRGKCENITYCVNMLETKGYFKGVCDDVSRMYIYYYIKAGYGDPIYVVVKTRSGELHAEVQYITKDGYIGCFYCIDGNLTDMRWGSEVIGISANRQPKDEYLYEVIKGMGRTVDGFPEDFANYVMKKDRRTVIHVYGDVKSDCPIEIVGCPLTGAEVYVSPEKVVCHVQVSSFGKSRVYYIVREFSG